MTKPPAPFSHWPAQPPGGWTIDAIRAAISEYEAGSPCRAYRLARAFGRSARYTQAKRQSLDTVQSLPLEVVAVEKHGSTALARRFAEEGRTMLGRLFAGGAERWLIEGGRVLNLGIGQLEWDTSTVPWTPVQIHEWPLECVRVDMYTRQLFALTDRGEVEIIPGDGRWVVYDPEGWLKWDGLVRCIGEPWYQSTMARRNVSNRAARSSVAVISAELPDSTDTTHPAALEWKTQLQQAQSGGAAGLLRPNGWPEPKTLDLGGSDPTDIMTLDLETSATDMIVAWLGQDGTAKNEGGSLAKAKVLGGVAYDIVEYVVRTFYGAMGPDGSWEPGCVTWQIMRPWVLYQEGGTEELVPLVRRVVPDLEEGERLKGEADRATAFRLEVRELRDMGVEMGPKEIAALAKLRGVRGYESLAVAEVQPPPQPIAPPGQNGGAP